MQPTHSSSRILQPVRPWFVYFTLFAAFALNLVPTAYFPWMPDWVAFVLCFWGVREPRRIGTGWGFLLGILMDIADASLMGQHALAYVLVVFAASALSRRILWFGLLQQALQVLPLLLLAQLVQLAARLLAGAEFPGWSWFVGPLFGTVLWVPGTYLLLLPQFQPVERDANRPI